MLTIWKHRESGALVEASDYGEQFTFCSAGGGWLRKMEASKFRSEFSPSGLPLEWRAGWFTMDDTGKAYPGYTQGRKWNGWACPTFSRAVALQILRDASPGWKYVALSNTIEYVGANDSMDNAIVCAAQPVFGIPCYDIGSGYWIWDEITPHDVAVLFVDELEQYLSGAEMTVIADRNRQEQKQHVCHTHDICDSNMLMLRVFGRLGLPTETSSFGSHAEGLWSSAWALAKPMMIERWTVK